MVHSYTPKNLDTLYNSARRPASKAGYSDTFRAKCSIREKTASFKAWNLETGCRLTVDQLKSEVDWPNSAISCIAQLSGVYFQASGYGPVLNVESLGLRTASVDCPFAFLEA